MSSPAPSHLRLSSAPDLGTAAEEGGRAKAALLKEKDALHSSSAIREVGDSSDEENSGEEDAWSKRVTGESKDDCRPGENIFSRTVVGEGSDGMSRTSGEVRLSVMF